MDLNELFEGGTGRVVGEFSGDVERPLLYTPAAVGHVVGEVGWCGGEWRNR